jgi:DNA-binding beta-propeller fold protein YncE
MGLAILVADAQGQVYAYDYQLRLVEIFEPSEDATQFPSISPQGLAVSPYGETYIVDGYNEVIFEYDPGGKFVGVLGDAQQSVFRLTRPTGIDVCDDGRLLICDTGLRRVLLISEVGDVLEVYEDADLWEPVCVVVTPDQKALFIGDRRTGELWLYSIDGYRQKSWVGSELTPKGIKSITDLQIMGDVLYLVDMAGEQLCLIQIVQSR